MVQIRVSPDHVLPDVEMTFKKFGSGGIRTHAPVETGALNQRLRPLGHATHVSADYKTLLPSYMYLYK